MSLLAAANDWLVGLLGPFGPLIAVGMLGVLMILVGFALSAAGTAAARQSVARRRRSRGIVVP